ncbi:MAG: type II methionyl aminopeptidase [Candidatus Marsarchaeota archaeon]|jgi:methionine aminopeptidase, type II|nr:type II methionyl aminopeptidase [Candidatus Marsarchaeota archaeon]MCL5094597.1 type II methionyl aminopeptidase [Candidatus Marsarchaeota archaeon]
MEKNNKINNSENIEVIKEVGAISYKALVKISERVKLGAKVMDIAKFSEDFLKENNYKPAFPLNISINDYAAHYSPKLGDEAAFEENQIVKLDFGAEKNGFFGDCAITIDLSNNNQKYIDATNEAVENALSIIRHGTRIRDIGREIAKTIESKNLKPIRNLGGHGVELNELHSDPFIPNFDNNDETELEEGMVIAIEPFATNGKGIVTETDFIEICRFNKTVNTRSDASRLLLNEIEKRFEKRPFAIKWLSDIVDSKFRLYSAINELIREDALIPSPALIELGNGIVSQTEIELIVEKDSCTVLTK